MICAEWLVNDLRYQIHKIALVSYHYYDYNLTVYDYQKSALWSLLELSQMLLQSGIIRQKSQIFREMFT